MGDFVRDRIAQEVIEIFREQLLVDAQAGLAVAVNSGLASAATAQGKVDCCFGQVDAVKTAGQLFRLTNDCFGLLLEVFVGHVRFVE